MKKCNFNYLYEKPNINDIENFITQLSNKYNIQLKNIKLLSDKVLINYDEEKFTQIMKEQKSIIILIIKDIIKFFPQLSNIPHIIFLHGSFAKSLNRMNSDIDLNVLYPNQFKNEVLPIEEIISIMLQKVIGYTGRDKIHTVMLYTIKKINHDLIEETEECSITFPDKQIYKYQCRPNYDEIMYKIKNSSREYNDFLNYIKNSITTNQCEEWCYSYEVIDTNCESYNLYEKINYFERINIKKELYNVYNEIIINLERTIDEYNFKIQEARTISDVNKGLKVQNLGFIYKTLALIKRYLFINDVHIQSLNFFEIFKIHEFTKLFTAEEITNIKKTIFKYLWQLSRIEKLFSDNNINFSSRNYNPFKCKEFCKLYKDLYNEDLINIQNNIVGNLHQSLRKILIRIERDEKKYE